MKSGTEQATRTIEMMEFLVKHLKRALTEKEAHFVSWLAVYEDATYDQVLALFKELVDKKDKN